MNTPTFRKSPLFRFIALTVLTAFACMLPVQPSYAQVAIIMPPPGQMIHITDHFEPPQMIGLKINLKDPFSFDFIMDRGQNPMADDVKKQEYNKIIKYFLVSLAMPNKDMWVNLSPYESQRIIPQVFAQTEMGRDLLAQDYILKQFTASLMYPENGLGKKFWDRVYSEAQARFGTTEINVNTFNKVWIVADHADVYQKDDTAFLIRSHLKVMLEQDYMAIEKNKEMFGSVQAVKTDETMDAKTKMASDVVRQIIIPAIEKEVNEGKSFAAVRQIYNAEIMATWFKKTLRQSLLGQVFANKGKINGQRVSDPQAMEKIYNQYLRAYKKGVFNYIREDATPDGQTIPRKYFSGGAILTTVAAVNAETPASLRAASPEHQSAMRAELAAFQDTETPAVAAGRIERATVGFRALAARAIGGAALVLALLTPQEKAVAQTNTMVKPPAPAVNTNRFTLTKIPTYLIKQGWALDKRAVVGVPNVMTFTNGGSGSITINLANKGGLENESPVGTVRDGVLVVAGTTEMAVGGAVALPIIVVDKGIQYGYIGGKFIVVGTEKGALYTWKGTKTGGKWVATEAGKAYHGTAKGFTAVGSVVVSGAKYEGQRGIDFGLGIENAGGTAIGAVPGVGYVFRWATGFKSDHEINVSLKAQLQASKQETTNQNNRANQLDFNLRSVTAERDNLHAALTNALADVASLQSTNQQTTARYQAATNLVASLTGQLGAANGQVRTLTGERDQARSDYQSSTNFTAGLQTRVGQSEDAFIQHVTNLGNVLVTRHPELKSSMDQFGAFSLLDHDAQYQAATDLAPKLADLAGQDSENLQALEAIVNSMDKQQTEEQANSSTGFASMAKLLGKLPQDWKPTPHVTPAPAPAPGTAVTDKFVKGDLSPKEHKLYDFLIGLGLSVPAVFAFLMFRRGNIRNMSDGDLDRKIQGDTETLRTNQNAQKAMLAYIAGAATGGALLALLPRLKNVFQSKQNRQIRLKKELLDGLYEKLKRADQKIQENPSDTNRQVRNGIQEQLDRARGIPIKPPAPPAPTPEQIQKLVSDAVAAATAELQQKIGEDAAKAAAKIAEEEAKAKAAQEKAEAALNQDLLAEPPATATEDELKEKVQKIKDQIGRKEAQVTEEKGKATPNNDLVTSLTGLLEKLRTQQGAVQGKLDQIAEQANTRVPKVEPKAEPKTEPKTEPQAEPVAATNLQKATAALARFQEQLQAKRQKFERTMAKWKADDDRDINNPDLRNYWAGKARYALGHDGVEYDQVQKNDNETEAYYFSKEREAAGGTLDYLQVLTNAEAKIEAELNSGLEALTTYHGQLQKIDETDRKIAEENVLVAGKTQAESNAVIDEFNTNRAKEILAIRYNPAEPGKQLDWATQQTAVATALSHMTGLNKKAEELLPEVQKAFEKAKTDNDFSKLDGVLYQMVANNDTERNQRLAAVKQQNTSTAAADLARLREAANAIKEQMERSNEVVKREVVERKENVGGINLSDANLTIDIKVDGAGMPLPAQFQNSAMINMSGLTSIIRKITPMTPESIPALYTLAQ